MLIILFSFERVNYLKISNLIQKTKDSLFNKNYLDSVSYFEKAKQIARNKNNLKKYFKEGQLSNLYINYGLLLIDRKEFINAEKQFREAKYLSNEDEKIQIQRFLHLIYVFQTKKCIESNERYRKIYCYQRPQFSRSRRYYLNTISRYSKSYPSYDLNKLNQLLISNNLKSLVQSCRNDIDPYYVDPRLNIFKGERFKELCIESKKLKTKKEYCDNPSFITPYFINKKRIIINSKQSHPVVYERMCS